MKPKSSEEHAKEKMERLYPVPLSIRIYLVVVIPTHYLKVVAQKHQGPRNPLR